MRIVYMGTPQFAAIILSELAQQHEVVAVYTRPDAVRGRGNALVASPVKEVALELGIPVFTPKSLRSQEEQDALRTLEPEAIVVAAYGMILPKEVLEIPVHGCVNAHASLLPRWRGAAPIERAILAGDAEVGVCAMRVDEGLDTGAYCASRSMALVDQTAEQLHEELAYLGAQTIYSALEQFAAGRVFWVEQDPELVTYAEKIAKGELDIKTGETVVMAARKVRAASEAHPCKVQIAGKNCSLLEARDCSADEQCPAQGIAAGTVAFMNKRLFLCFEDGPLEVLRLKPEGKKDMEAKAFAAGIQNIKTNTLTWRTLSE